jgi:MtN3 and saliva related transmembrane protein
LYFAAMSSLDLLGLFAAVVTSLAFVPQLVKSIRARDTASISLFMYVLFVLGVGSWVVWSWMAWQIPVLLENGLIFILASIILIMKIFAVITKKEQP